MLFIPDLLYCKICKGYCCYYQRAGGQIDMRTLSDAEFTLKSYDIYLVFWICMVGLLSYFRNFTQNCPLLKPGYIFYCKLALYATVKRLLEKLYLFLTIVRLYSDWICWSYQSFDLLESITLRL